MKKTLLLFALSFHLTLLFGQQKLTYNWGPWVQNPCFKGLQSRSKVRDYNESAKKYTWDIEIKNNYGIKVSFNYDIQNSSLDGRVSINAGGTEKTWALHPSNTIIYIGFSKVCFDPNDRCSINSNGVQNKGYKCYADCDNGVSNTPALCGNTSSTSSVATTNQQQKPADAQRVQQEAQRQNQENVNRQQQYVNAINAGVQAHNSGNYTEAKTQFNNAVGLSVTTQQRATAQDYYNKTVSLEKSQAKVQTAVAVVNAAQPLVEGISGLISDLKRQKREREVAYAQQRQEEAKKVQEDYQNNPGKQEYDMARTEHVINANYDQAIVLYKQSAAKNYFSACEQLFYAYSQGEIAVVDLKQAIHYAMLAVSNAKSNNLKSNWLMKIGNLLRSNELGTDKNIPEAIETYKAAFDVVDNDDKFSKYLASASIGYSYVTEKDKMQNSYKEALSWFQKSLEFANGEMKESLELSVAKIKLEGGHGVEKNTAEGEQALKKLQESQNYRILTSLAFLYLDGETIEKSSALFTQLISRAVALPGPNPLNCGAYAKMDIGYQYLKRNNLPEAEKWFAEIGNCKTQKEELSGNYSYIARYYYGKTAEHPNYERSAYWLQKSVDASKYQFGDDFYLLAQYYLNGTGVEKDPKKALKYLKKDCKYNARSCKLMATIKD